MLVLSSQGLSSLAPNTLAMNQVRIILVTNFTWVPKCSPRNNSIPWMGIPVMLKTKDKLENGGMLTLIHARFLLKLIKLCPSPSALIVFLHLIIHGTGYPQYY